MESGFTAVPQCRAIQEKAKEVLQGRTAGIASLYLTAHIGELVAPEELRREADDSPHTRRTGDAVSMGTEAR